MTQECVPLSDTQKEAIIQQIHQLPFPKEYDVEDTVISTKLPATVIVQIVIDRDGGVDLDALSAVHLALENDIAEKIELIIGTDHDYEIEFTSRGVNAPLIHPRHWKRNFKRKVSIKFINNEQLSARIGKLSPDEESITLITNDKGKLASCNYALNDIKIAKLEVEFKPGSSQELALCEE